MTKTNKPEYTHLILRDKMTEETHIYDLTGPFGVPDIEENLEEHMRTTGQSVHELEEIEIFLAVLTPMNLRTKLELVEL